MNKFFLVAGAVFATLAVMLGAFGAHGLNDILVQHSRVNTFETAVEYHFYHSFALIITGILFTKLPGKGLITAGIAFIIGLFLFSGSLYILSLTGITALGMITPFGGLSFIIGWIAIATAALKYKQV